MFKMDNPTYHTRNYYPHLKDTLQKHQDDLNWATSKVDLLTQQLTRTPPSYTQKKKALQEEIITVQNQIDIFNRMITKTKKEIADYEEMHRTSTQNRRFKRTPSLAKRRAWAKGKK